MKRVWLRIHLVLLLGAAACSGTARNPSQAGVQAQATGGAEVSPAAVARADGGQPPYTAADVRFMTGMIRHHAQALLMAQWAFTHDAGESIRVVAERILVSQQDEIELMQRWLEERNEPVPHADASHELPGTDHSHLMPGMLTSDQLRQLDDARGVEFDRLFLTFMIQHHEGAIRMVEALFSSHAAAHDEDIFKFASDVHADQSSEIDRMSRMLTAISTQGRIP